MPENEYIEQVPIQRESTTVKKPLLDTGQRKIKVKEDKLAMEIAQQILSDARTQSNGIASGKFNTDYPLQAEHPELLVIPATAEIKAAGLVPGMFRLAVGTVTGNEIGKQSTNIGQKIDSKLGTRIFAPTFGFIGGLGGYAFGSGFTGNILSRIPRKYSYGPTNERTYWAEDQTPKYNSSQITERFGKTTVTETPTITKQNAASITDTQWDAAYNEAVKSGNIAEIERLRKLHFIVKTPGNKLVNENNNPHLVWHGSPKNWTIFDDWKRGTEDVIYFSTDKSYADQFTIPRKNWKIGMIPKKSSRGFYLYGKEPLDIGTDMDSQLVQERMREAWLNGKIHDSAYGLDVWTPKGPLKQSNGIEIGVVRRNQMKLADPITYDDSGQIIPLSQRDDFGNPDIRYGYASLESFPGTLQQVDKFIENDMFPRLQKAGHNVQYSTTIMPSLRVYNKNSYLDRTLGNDAGAGFNVPSNSVILRTSPEKTDFGLLLHEIGGHGLRYNIHPSYRPKPQEQVELFIKALTERGINPNSVHWPGLNVADQLYTPKEEDWLRSAWENWFKGGKGEGNLHEFGAVNTQMRAKISQQNGYITGDALDAAIDNYPDAKLLSMLRAQPYTSNGTLNILEKETGISAYDLRFMSEIELNDLIKKYPSIHTLLDLLRKSMKYVAGVSAVGIGMNNIPQKQE